MTGNDTHAGTIREAHAIIRERILYGPLERDHVTALAALDALVAERDHARAALRRAREDFIMVRDEMEVSTQEAFVDAAIARVDAVLVGTDVSA